MVCFFHRLVLPLRGARPPDAVQILCAFFMEIFSTAQNPSSRFFISPATRHFSNWPRQTALPCGLTSSARRLSRSLAGQCSILSRQYSMLSRQCPILTEQYPIVTRQYPIRHRQYPKRYQQCPIRHRQCEKRHRQCPKMFEYGQFLYVQSVGLDRLAVAAGWLFTVSRSQNRTFGNHCRNPSTLDPFVILKECFTKIIFYEQIPQ